MWVCDGVKLSIGIKFDPVVFLCLLIDTLYGSILFSIQLVGYMKVIYPSNIIKLLRYRTEWVMEECRVKYNTTINGGAGGYNRLRGYFHFIYSYGIYTTQHSHHNSGGMHIHIMKIGEMHITQGYHRRVVLGGCCCLGWNTVAMINVIQCDILGERDYKQSRTVYNTYTTINHRCVVPATRNVPSRSGELQCNVQQSMEIWWIVRSTECECSGYYLYICIGEIIHCLLLLYTAIGT